MFSIIALVVGGLFVAGFYGYVFVHLYSEFLKQRVRHSRSIHTSAQLRLVPPQNRASTTASRLRTRFVSATTNC